MTPFSCQSTSTRVITGLYDVTHIVLYGMTEMNIRAMITFFVNSYRQDSISQSRSHIEVTSVSTQHILN